MFTGLIEELGRFVRSDDHRFTFSATTVLEDAAIGDSISVNGCCLTVVALSPATWSADVVDETLARTALGDLRPGDPVNLERPVKLDGRLGGHLVQGHVDAVGQVTRPAPDLAVTSPHTRYLVEKGSISVDGVSLTVVDLTDGGFTVAVIPHTAEVTTLGTRRPGDRVNLEFDLIAKYVAKSVERLLPGSRKD
ncbi:MAG: riboflavin synthase [Actinomycetota bacterium]|nr:riboflavin synthase [Actinomycetota bacterium]